MTDAGGKQQGTVIRLHVVLATFLVTLVAFLQISGWLLLEKYLNSSRVNVILLYKAFQSINRQQNINKAVYMAKLNMVACL